MKGEVNHIVLILTYMFGVFAVMPLSWLINRNMGKGLKCIIEKRPTIKPTAELFACSVRFFIYLVPATTALVRHGYYYELDRSGNLVSAVREYRGLFWTLFHQIGDALISLIVLVAVFVILFSILEFTRSEKNNASGEPELPPKV